MVVAKRHNIEIAERCLQKQVEQKAESTIVISEYTYATGAS